MTTRTYTDNRALEAMFTDTPTFCHLFVGSTATFAQCGVPRSEQPAHGHVAQPGDPYLAAEYCPDCGLPRCATCREASS